MLYETPPFIGKERLKTLLMKIYYRLLKPLEPVIIDSADGRKFKADLTDGMYNALYFTGFYEKNETLYFRNVIKPGEVVLDIGANFGWYTTLFSELVGKTGKIVSFEPVPRIYRELLENIALNDPLKNITAIQTSLGDREGTVTINTFQGLSHGHSSISTLGREDYTTCSVPMTTLDACIDDHLNGRRIAMIKMDVEGAEMMVIRGAEQLLRNAADVRIMFEINSETASAFDYHPTDIIKTLEGYGFSNFCRIGEGGIPHRLNLNLNVEHGDNIICQKN